MGDARSNWAVAASDGRFHGLDVRICAAKSLWPPEACRRSPAPRGGKRRPALLTEDPARRYPVLTRPYDVWVSMGEPWTLG